MLPSFSEVHVHVVVKLFSCQVQVLLDNFSGSLLCSFLINPELWVLLEIIVVLVAASAIASTILRQFPSIGQALSEAAVAVAAAIQLNFEVVGPGFAESIPFLDQSVHELVIGISRVPVWNKLFLCSILLFNGYCDISILHISNVNW